MEENLRTESVLRPEKEKGLAAKTSFRPRISIENQSQKSTKRSFGEVYICNEDTKNEFFRVDEFNTFDVLKFEGAEDHLIVFFKDEQDNHKIAAIEK